MGINAFTENSGHVFGIVRILFFFFRFFQNFFFALIFRHCILFGHEIKLNEKHTPKASTKIMRKSQNELQSRKEKLREEKKRV